MNLSERLERFTNRAEYDARYRPGYPDEVMQIIAQQAGWSPQATVADIGAGTGISSELFLRHGNEVWAIEPNAEMRAAAECLKTQYPRFHLREGVAEQTGLPDGSVDFVVAATAFHWFDADRSRDEFRRILKPGGHVVLLWNKRRTETSRFLQSYDEILLRFSTDYKERWGKQRTNLGRELASFFRPTPYGSHSVESRQILDFDGLKDRLLSSSYAPLPGEPNFEPMIAALQNLFDAFQHQGRVAMEYETLIYWGLLSKQV